MDKKISIQKKVRGENDRLAADIRLRLNKEKIVALNLVSSPGSGKTSLLEKTLHALNDRLNIILVAGDVQTKNDADRLSHAGGKIVRPIITGGACHLDAKMVTTALLDLDLKNADVLFIENVGNLVCPAGYDLGEDMKVVLVSTTEGDDKPMKYPVMFRNSSAMVINKTDLLGYSDFNIENVKKNARSINPALRIFEVSCRTSQGLDQWYDWLLSLVARKKRN
jgi:hydrogenase nickel incorporation protein HypB